MEDFCESRETQIFANLFGTIYTLSMRWYHNQHTKGLTFTFIPRTSNKTTDYITKINIRPTF